jgi:hypothetical protein
VQLVLTHQRAGGVARGWERERERESSPVERAARGGVRAVVQRRLVVARLLLAQVVDAQHGEAGGQGSMSDFAAAGFSSKATWFGTQQN